MANVMSLNGGPEYLIRRILMPFIRQSYDDLLLACDDACLLVSHPLTFVAPMIADIKKSGGMSWASVAITPTIMLSAHDPCVLAPALWLQKFRFLGPAFVRLVYSAMNHAVAPWAGPWHNLRSELGLPRSKSHPVLGQLLSPDLVLALFSSTLVPVQPDWPQNTVVCGFPGYDGHGELGQNLQNFFDDGEPPIVFTLGSAAVMSAGDFYRESVEAAKLLGRRGVLLVGKDPRNVPPNLPVGVAAFDYAPYSAIFHRASAIVHQGGIGTTGQALRSGRPMLVVPFAFDQPDNAARVARLGSGRTLTRANYTTKRAASELRTLLNDRSYSDRASEIAASIRHEDGAVTACDAIETLLRRRPR